MASRVLSCDQNGNPVEGGGADDRQMRSNQNVNVVGGFSTARRLRQTMFAKTKTGIVIIIIFILYAW